MKKFLLILIPIILIIAGLYFFFMRQNTAVPDGGQGVDDPLVFTPIGRGGTPSGDTGGISSNGGQGTGITTSPVTTGETAALPRIRRISLTPVGGFAASSTASSSLVRHVDRGAGHIFETKSILNTSEKISNITIPRVYESYWNKNGTAGIFRYAKDETGIVANFYGELRPIPRNASSTSDSTTAFEIKGKFLSNTIEELAVSPRGDRVFTYNIENGTGVGYVSGFDESKKTKVFETPLTQVNVEWPEENTIALSTKASGLSAGFLYLVDLKKPTLRRVLGEVTGLSAKVSADGKKVIYSSTGPLGFTTRLLNTADNSVVETVFRTTTDKCVWSKKYTDELYCAVPTEFPRGIYPDDWYRGTLSFVDQIWHMNTRTGEVHLIINLLKEANDIIDVVNLTLDPKEEFLYFVNKRDLTLWSVDLNK